MKIPYIVWTANRQKKAIFLIDSEEPDAYQSLIFKASSKFGINGNVLVLEASGTPVEEEILPYVKTEVLLLLESDEEWMPGNKHERSFASCSTLNLVNETTDNVSTSTGASSLDQQTYTIQDTGRSTDNNIFSVSVDCNSENMWKNFNVLWDKLALDVQQKLQNGSRDKHISTTLVQLVVDEMRYLKKVIPCKAFKLVAKKIIDRYPEVFIDKDEDGILLGDGTHSLVNKLIDRNNYLNRPHHKRKSSDSPNPVASKKKFDSARAGCINWSPIQNEDVSFTPDSEKRIRESDENFYAILEKRYPEIREFLNHVESPSVLQILEEWPIVFSRKSIKWHFSKLTNSDIDLLNQFSTKSNQIITFTNKKLKKEPNLTESDNYCTIIITALDNIAKYFSEDMSMFFKTYKNLSEVDVESLALTPSVIYIDGDKENTLYYVYIEKTNIDLQGYPDFEEALKVAFSLYFILNLKYPPKFEATMELLQRMFLKIHPDAESKSKKNHKYKKKVINFMNSFNKYSCKV